MKKTLAIYLAVFLIIVMAIFMFISCSSFKAQMVDNKVSLTEANGTRLVEKIEGGLFYGKTLDNYYGIEDSITSWAANDPNVVNVRVTSADGKTVYYQMVNEDKYEKIPVNDELSLEISQGNNSGCLNIVISLEDVTKQVREIEKMFAIIIGILLLLSIGAIIVCIKRGVLTDRKNNPDKKKILIMMLTTVFVMQIVFTGYSYYVLDNCYEEMASNTVKQTEHMVQQDLDKVISFGIDYKNLYQFDEYTDSVCDMIPMVSDIYVNDNANVEVKASQGYIKQSLHELLLNMLTALITSLFIATEIVNYMFVSINRKVGEITGKTSYDKPAAVRAASFLIHVACYLPISFVPAMMNQFTGGDASNFVLGLPTMVLLFCSLIFTLFAGKLCQQWGWKKVLFCGVLILVVSSLIAGFVDSAVMLVIARGLYGAAYALIYVAIREFAASSSDMEQRSKGLSQVTAGLYAGINIGAVAGAMIYDSIGFMGVFIISALLGCISMFVIKRHLVAEEKESKVEEIENKTEEIENKTDVVSVETQNPQSNTLKTIVSSRDFVKLAIFIIAPLAVAALFFDYFLPIYSVNAGISSADIGRAFLINGIAVAYVVPMIMRKMNRDISEREKVVVFSVTMAFGFLIFALIGGTWGIYIASFIMGVAEGVALVSQNMIMLSLPLTDQIGSGQMLATYALVRKLAQTIGPQIFTLFMILGDRSGMMIMGTIMVITCLIYLMVTRKDTKQHE